MKNNIRDRISLLIGRRLIRVRASLFAFEGNTDYDNPQQLELDFGLPLSGSLMCDVDGSSISWTDRPLEAFDLGSAGKRVVEDISRRRPWHTSLGASLMSAEVIVEIPSGDTVGLGLQFPDAEICIVNLGDELFVYDQFPTAAFEAGEVERIRVLTKL